MSHSQSSSVSGGGGNSYGNSQHLSSLGGGGGGAGNAASALSQLGGLGNVSTMQQLLAASQNSMTGQHQMFDTSEYFLVGSEALLR